MQAIHESVPLKQMSSSDAEASILAKYASNGQNKGTYVFSIWLYLTELNLTLRSKAKS
jgi:hypothetical protein